MGGDAMTDLELFLAFYKQIGVDLEPISSKENNNIVYGIGNADFHDMGLTISDKFDGYGGFYSDIEFTKNGKFVRQGFWE